MEVHPPMLAALGQNVSQSAAWNGVPWGVSLILKPILWLLQTITGTLFSLVNTLMQATVFHPIVLGARTGALAGCGPHSDLFRMTGSLQACRQALGSGHVAASGVVGMTVASLWHQMGQFGLGAAFLFMLIGALKMHFGHAQMTAGEGGKEIAGGVAVFGATLLASYEVIRVMLQINNQFVVQLGSMIQVQGLSSPHIQSLIGNLLVTGGMAVGVIFFGQVLGLMAGVFLVWALASWFIRMFELIFFSLILPITAAAAIGGYRHAWEWNVREIAAAIFTQSGQAFAWYLVLYIISRGFGGIWTNLVGFFIGVMGFFFIAKVPEYMQSLFGHRHTGGLGVGAGVFAGYVGARVGGAALGASRGGAALGQWSGMMQERAKAHLLRGAVGKTVSERFAPGSAVAKSARGIDQFLGKARHWEPNPETRAGALRRAGITVGKVGGKGIGHVGYGAIDLGRAVTAPRTMLGRKAEQWAAYGNRADGAYPVETRTIASEGAAAARTHAEGLPAPDRSGASWMNWRRQQVKERIERAARDHGPRTGYR